MQNNSSEIPGIPMETRVFQVNFSPYRFSNIFSSRHRQKTGYFDQLFLYIDFSHPNHIKYHARPHSHISSAWPKGRAEPHHTSPRVYFHLFHTLASTISTKIPLSSHSPSFDLHAAPRQHIFYLFHISLPSARSSKKRSGACGAGPSCIILFIRYIETSQCSAECKLCTLDIGLHGFICDVFFCTSSCCFCTRNIDFFWPFSDFCQKSYLIS